MESDGPRRKRSRSIAPHGARIAGESVTLGEHLLALHKSGAPIMFLKIIYYLCFLNPPLTSNAESH